MDGFKQSSSRLELNIRPRWLWVLGGGLEWPVCLHVYTNIVKGEKLRFSIRAGGRFDQIKVPPHIRLTAVPPQSLTYQTDSSTTTKPDNITFCVPVTPAMYLTLGPF